MQAMQMVLEAIRASHERDGKPRRLLIALSGGADSMLLAHGLHLLRQELQLELSCVHVHHGLRQASDEDEAFVRAYCQGIQMPLVVKHLGLAPGSNQEERAREARYQAFDEAMASCKAQLLALGHHQDDQAETVLLRLISGAGATGLSAMRELSGYLWRPMLGINRATILAAVGEAQLSWREDESNQQRHYRRNALRLDAMPLLEAIAPGAAGAMARSAHILQTEEDYWQAFVADWLYEHGATRGCCVFLMADACLQLPLAARRRVLRGLCAAAGIRCEFSHTERLLGLLAGPPNRYENLPGDARAMRSRTRLHMMPCSRTLPQPGLLQAVEGEALPQPKEALQQALDLDQIAGSAFRYRQPGDRILPLGAGGSKALSEYLSDHLVDLPFRDCWPILARGQEVLWVVGIGISQRAALTHQTKRAGLVAYAGRMPHWLDAQQHQGE